MREARHKNKQEKDHRQGDGYFTSALGVVGTPLGRPADRFAVEPSLPMDRMISAEILKTYAVERR